MNRRSFLLLTAASVVAPPVEFIHTIAATPDDRSKAWYAVMRRCGQINYNERDPLDINVEAWGDYWASLKVDAVLLNGGGIVAFYAPPGPHHHRSQVLGTPASFGAIGLATKPRGMP